MDRLTSAGFISDETCVVGFISGDTGGVGFISAVSIWELIEITVVPLDLSETALTVAVVRSVPGMRDRSTEIDLDLLECPAVSSSATLVSIVVLKTTASIYK